MRRRIRRRRKEKSHRENLLVEFVGFSRSTGRLSLWVTPTGQGLSGHACRPRRAQSAAGWNALSRGSMREIFDWVPAAENRRSGEGGSSSWQLEMMRELDGRNADAGLMGY